jgi:hypothetical protein
MARSKKVKQLSSKGSRENVPLTNYDLSLRMVLMSFSTAMARPLNEKRPCSKGSRETFPLTDYDLSPRMVLMSFSTAMALEREMAEF